MMETNLAFQFEQENGKYEFTIENIKKCNHAGFKALPFMPYIGKIVLSQHRSPLRLEIEDFNFKY